jgi:hypothetical protein
MVFLLKTKKNFQNVFFEDDVVNYIFQKIKLKNKKEKIQSRIENIKKRKGNNGVDEIFKLLHWELNTLTFKHCGIKSEYIKSLSEFIYGNEKINKDMYESFLNCFYSINPASLSISNWNKISYICNANGLFRLSGICRRKLIDYITERYKGNKKIVSLIAMFKVSIDLGDYKMAGYFINQAIAINKSDYVRYLYEKFYDYELRSKVEKSSENIFADLINNKKVVIVAPGLVDINESIIDEINSFDLMILFNYKGKKIDERFNIPFISYYNTDSALKLKPTFNNFFNDLKFAVFKSDKYTIQQDVLEQGRAKYVDRDLSNFFIVNYPNMLQIILDDILMYNAKKIKVFGSNFYLSENIYFDGYNDPDVSMNMCRSFAHHNILSQVNYIRNLYKIDVIELDKACLNVINMEESELLDAYERIYSNIA